MLGAGFRVEHYHRAVIALIEYRGCPQRALPGALLYLAAGSVTLPVPPV